MFLAPVTTDLGQNGEVEEFVSSMCLSDFLESYAEIMGMSLLIFLMFIHFFEEKNNPPHSVLSFLCYLSRILAEFSINVEYFEYLCIQS